MADEDTAVAEAPPDTMYAGAPPSMAQQQSGGGGGGPVAAPVRAPLPSISEQMHRWEVPGQGQGGGSYSPDDLQNYNDELLKWAGQSSSSKEFNAKLDATRQAASAATEFVRRKEVESLVRGGANLEDAEFKSRVKYNTASGGQLNALRPVRPPTAMEVGGVPGVTTGRGDQWKPFPNKPAPKPTPEQIDATQYHKKMRDAGIKLRDKILSEQKKYAETQDPEVAVGIVELQKQYANQQELTRASREAKNGPIQPSGPSHPKIGDVKGKHRYKGGNPADKNSWELVR